MTATPALNEFFGVYFHQDWVLDYETWENAVDAFAADNPTDVRDAIEDLTALTQFSDDTEIEAALRELGCSYRDRSALTTYRDWLGQVVARLEAAADGRIRSVRTAS